MALTDMLAKVQLGDEEAQRLADACATKASGLREAREALAARFGDKSRVATADVLAWLDSDAEDYERGSSPSYWQSEREAPAPEPAPKRTPRKRASAPAEAPAEA